MHGELGIFEHMFWLFDQVVPIHFTLTARIVGELYINQLQQALTMVQQRHPLLRVRIVPTVSNQPWFIEDSASIPLGVVERQNEQQWLSEVEQELLHPFDWNQAPLMRTVLLHALDVSELIITCHHSIGDGMSTVYLLKDILQTIGIANYQQQILPERPPLEQLTPEFIQGIQNSLKEKGRLNIPQQYGELRLAAVYTPSVLPQTHILHLEK